MALSLGIAGVTFGMVPQWAWSGVRLANSARLLYGLPLYAAPGGANLTDWCYGPFTALMYLPAMIASTPLGALRLAGILNGAYFTIPLAALVWPVAFAWRRPALALILLATGLAGLLVSFTGWYAAACLSTDTVSVGFGVVSCLILGRRGPLWLAGVLAAAAVWTKQTEFPLVVAQPVFLLLSGRRTDALPSLLYGLGALVAFGLVFCGWFGFGALYLGMVVVPKGEAIQFAQFFRATDWAGWVLVVAAAVLALRRVPAEATGFAPMARLLALAGVFLLPGGLMASAKVGGAANSVHCVSYAALALVALMADRLLQETPGSRRWGGAAVAAGLAVSLAVDAARIVTFGQDKELVDSSRHDAAYAFILARPGLTYFPWYPLSQLMAERRAYPVDYGATDWRLSHQPLSQAQLRAEIPSGVQFVVYHKSDQGREMLGCLTDYKWERHTDDWAVFTRTP